VDVLKKKITKKGSVMMFVTIQDQTGRIEMLVFPKTYEETKDMWKEGNVVCVVGKTPKEEGDNKIFVEKAYALTRDNVEEVSRYLGFGNTSQQDEIQKKYITINLTQQELKKYTNDLKNLLEKYPGDFDVYVQVGMNTIRAQSQVEWGSELEERLDELLGPNKIEIQK